MFIKHLSSILLTAGLCVIAGVLFSGCAGQKKELELELAQERASIQDLQAENEDLRVQLAQKDEVIAQEIAMLESSRQALMAALQGTGAGVETSNNTLVVSLPSVLLFGPGQYTLKKKSKKHLAKIAKVLKSNFPNATIRVAGYTDNTPIKKLKKKFKSNWELSAARAGAVLHYFIDKGRIKPQNIYLAGFGAYHPVSSNSTAAGRKKNRRVAIVVLPEGD